MKKVTILGVVLILLAVSVFPVMAATNQSNGRGNGQGNGQGNAHGNGVNTGQSNAGGNGDQTKERDQVRLSNPGRGAIHGAHGIQNTMRMRTPFYLQGTITAIGSMTETLTISLTHGNAQVKEFFGTGITVTATGAVIFRIDQSNGDESEGTTASTNDEGTTGNRQPIQFSDLQVGQYVAIHGNLVNGVYQARLITVYIRTPLGETTENP